MPTFSQGDIVRVPFPYTDRHSTQGRPALVVSTGSIGDIGGLLWVIMITSALNRRWSSDISLETRFEEAGLPVPSLIRPSKIATIDERLAAPLGKVPPDILADVLDSIGAILGMAHGRSVSFHEG